MRATNSRGNKLVGADLTVRLSCIRSTNTDALIQECSCLQHYTCEVKHACAIVIVDIEMMLPA